MKTTTISTLLLTMFLFGCAAPREVLFDQTKRQPTISVDIFQDGNKPTKQYKEIGVVAFEDFGGEETSVLKLMIERAKHIGADALIIKPREDTGYNFNPFGRSGNKYMFKAIAVVYQ